jgi:hypothetical protein
MPCLETTWGLPPHCAKPWHGCSCQVGSTAKRKGRSYQVFCAAWIHCAVAVLQRAWHMMNWVRLPCNECCCAELLPVKERADRNQVIFCWETIVQCNTGLKWSKVGHKQSKRPASPTDTRSLHMKGDVDCGPPPAKTVAERRCISEWLQAGPKHALMGNAGCPKGISCRHSREELLRQSSQTLV